MALSGNQVVPLTITTLTPLHIGTGSRLAANLDYYTLIASSCSYR
jgi:CRISPR/Cas system CSM-associated protein Csm5 (group 7 of RAMP superfamily)